MRPDIYLLAIILGAFCTLGFAPFDITILFIVGFAFVYIILYAFRIPTTIAIGTSVFQAVFTTMIVTFLHAQEKSNLDSVIDALKKNLNSFKLTSANLLIKNP